MASNLKVHRPLNTIFSENSPIKMMGGKLFFVCVLIFGLAYSQEPLYSSSQNTYFIHGLGDAHIGFLAQDWLNQTADPVPVFSFFVTITAKFLHEALFYGYFIAVLGIYLYSLLGIVTTIYPLQDSRLQYITYSILIIAFHAALLNPPVHFSYGKLLWFLQAGVAKQELLGTVLQPSTMGVFILLSIYAFLRGRAVFAIILLGLSATLHPTYLLSAALLTVIYLFLLFKEERKIHKVVWLGVLAFSLVLPIVSYTYLSFGATTPELFRAAQEILVNYRIKYQCSPQEWFETSAVIQLGIVLLALFLIRKTGAFLILFPLLFAAILLTVLQVITGYRTLALLFPWRLSVFLVPLSTCLIVAACTQWSFKRFKKVVDNSRKIIRWMVGLVAIILPTYGLIATFNAFAEVNRSHLRPLMDFVKRNQQPHSLYLIPVYKQLKGSKNDLQRFRLYTGVPVFVDTKSHPYKDIEVIEWYKRVDLADQFYREPGENACLILQTLVTHYGITQVVLENANVKNCVLLQKPIYRDDYFSIYDVTGDKNI